MGGAVGRAGVGVRVYVEGGEVARTAFKEMAQEGKAMFAEIAAGAQRANPALKLVSAGVHETKDKIRETAAEAGGFGRVLGSIGPIGIGMAAAVGAATLALEQFKQAAEFGHQLEMQAKSAGISTTALQQYQYALEEAGGKASDAGGAIQAFTEKFDQAANGLSPRTLKAFQAIGISKEQLKSFKDSDEALNSTIEHIAALSKEQDRLGEAAKLGLSPMIALIDKGSEKVRELRQEASDLGYVMDADVVEKLAEASKQFEATSHIIDVQFKQAFVDLAPVILDTMKLVAALAHEISDVFDGFKKLEDRRRGALVDERATLLAGAMEDLSRAGDPVHDRLFQQRQKRLQEIDAELNARALASQIQSDLGPGSGARRGTGLIDQTPPRKAKRDGSGQFADSQIVILNPIGSPDISFDPSNPRPDFDPHFKGAPHTHSTQAVPGGLGDVTLDLGALGNYLRDVDEASKHFGETLSHDVTDGLHDLTSGLAEAIVYSRNLGDVAANVFRKILYDLLNNQIEKGVSALLKVGSKVLGNVLQNGIPGFADGVENFGGGMAYVHKDEVLTYLPPGTDVYSARDARRMMGGVNLGGVHISLDARGAGPREVDLLRGQLAELQRSLPGMIVEHVNQGVDRGLIGA